MEKVESEGYAVCIKKSTTSQELSDFIVGEEYLFNEINNEIKAGNEHVLIKYFKLFPNSDFPLYCEIVREKDFNMYFKIKNSK